MTSSYFPDIIDSSMMATFKSCPEKFRKEYVEDWKSKEVSVHLHAGAAFAKGLEVARTAHYVEGKSPETSVALGLAALLKAYGNFQCPPDSAKSAERMAGAFEFYFDNYPLNWEGSQPISIAGMNGPRRAIEYSFAHPLPITNPVTGNPLLYCGRMDAIINYAGQVYICDEKTTSQLGPTWSRKWELRSQFTGYAWGCRQSGIHVDGSIIRGVSILKTKYETQQAIVFHPDWQIDRWYRELLVWIHQMITCWATGVWPHQLDDSCNDYGGCPFKQCCSVQDEQPWLETYFERRRWNPLLRQETKV